VPARNSNSKTGISQAPHWNSQSNAGGTIPTQERKKFRARLINWLRPVHHSRHEPSTDCVPFLVPATNHQRIACRSWFPSRTINRSRPVLGSRHEPSTDRVLLLVPVTNHQPIASRSWFPSRTINRSHPVLGSRHEPSTGAASHFGGFEIQVLKGNRQRR